jgi:microcystin-dependent protein
MNTCIKCGCEDAYPSLPPCPTPEGCPNPQPCAEFFDAQCVRFSLPNIVCGLDTVVFQDDTVAEALDNIVSYFCQRLVTLTNYINAQLLIVNNRFTTIEGDITNIEGDISDIRTDINNIEVEINDIKNDITTIQGDITTIQGDITTIEGDITTINTQIGEAMPIGSVIPWAGKSSLPLPDGWLPCDGTLRNIIAYPELFDVIADEYGSGAPVGQFYLPNLIDAIPYGNNSASVGIPVGNNTQAGNVSVDISIANLPEHTHSLTGIVTGESGEHTHTYHTSNSGGGSGNRANSGGADNDNSPTTELGGNHTHTLSGNIGNTGFSGTTQATGTITSGDNRQRGISMRYMIKY